MDPKNRGALKAAAQNSLAQTTADPRRLVLIHAGAAVLLSVVLNLLSYLLSLQIDKSTGLGGMQTRTLLSTLQSSLSVAATVIIPFWDAGFLFTTLCISRGQGADDRSLLAGFRNFGPLLRFFLLQGLILFGVGMVAFFVGMQLFLFTPFSNRLFEIVETLDTGSILSGAGALPDAATQAMIMEAYTPMLLMFLALFVVGVALVSYLYRQSLFILFDRPGTGALAAMRESRMQMRGNKKNLFLLDLSFWWYYLAQLLIAMISYVPMILAMFQVSLPLSPTAVSYLCLGVTLLAQMGFACLFRYRVETTFAHFYLATLPRQI